MKPSGIHLLLTYKCNAACRHCFLNCGPERQGVMPVDRALHYIQDAHESSYINHFFVEGGEPFLYPKKLNLIVRAAADNGFWIGALTNGFWATSKQRAREVLTPLAAAGLKSLGISTDYWHREFVPLQAAKTAADTARELGLESDLMVCAGGRGAAEVVEQLKDHGYSVYAGRVSCRGRAVTAPDCRRQGRNWRSFDKCRESFGGTARVHIDPDGGIHLCQGLLLGRNAAAEPLLKIFSDFKLHRHPLAAALAAGGPAALAEFARGFGFKPDSGYADGCQLCFTARAYLQPYFPGFLGPPEVYDIQANIA